MMMVRPAHRSVVFGAQQPPRETPEAVQNRIEQGLTAQGYKVTQDVDAYVNDRSNQVVIGSRSLGINPSAGPILITINMRAKNPDQNHTELKAFIQALSKIPGATAFRVSGNPQHAQYSGNIGRFMVSVSELDLTA